MVWLHVWWTQQEDAQQDGHVEWDPEWSVQVALQWCSLLTPSESWPCLCTEACETPSMPVTSQTEINSEENVACQNKRKCFYLEMEVGKRRKLPLWTKNSLQLFQIYQWMTQIQKNNSELVTQHFLGKTFENRTMYYLQVREELSLNNKTDLNKKKKVLRRRQDSDVS